MAPLGWRTGRIHRHHLSQSVSTAAYHLTRVAILPWTTDRISVLEIPDSCMASNSAVTASRWHNHNAYRQVGNKFPRPHCKAMSTSITQSCLPQDSAPNKTISIGTRPAFSPFPRILISFIWTEFHGYILAFPPAAVTAFLGSYIFPTTFFQFPVSRMTLCIHQKAARAASFVFLPTSMMRPQRMIDTDSAAVVSGTERRQHFGFELAVWFGHRRMSVNAWVERRGRSIMGGCRKLGSCG
jgi:hypothetical protein